MHALLDAPSTHAHCLVHRYTGTILAAVNPFENLPIYGTDKMPPYVNKPLGIADPHVYAMAEEVAAP